MSREQTIGLDIDPTLKPALYRRLFEKGATLTPLTDVTAIGDGAVHLEHVYAGTRREAVVDLVVLSLGGTAEDGLYLALRSAAPELPVYRAGDCVAPRYLYDATYEATRVGRQV
ncbi:MAG: hypothetical protein M3354_07520 [Chloroflexota bacterium]|nr:hypothetical protein [Chloroflexota bacterium]